MNGKPELRLPLENIRESPIKKSYEYYKHFGNSWNSKYLSSPKISKYYLDPQENYLSGPSSPVNISLQESTERTRLHQEKATKSKLESRQRLFERKQARELIQHKSKQITDESLPGLNETNSNTHKRPFTSTYEPIAIRMDTIRFRSMSIHDPETQETKKSQEKIIVLQKVVNKERNQTYEDVLITTNKQHICGKKKKKDFYDFIRIHKSRKWVALLRASVGRKRCYCRPIKDEKKKYSETVRKEYAEYTDGKKIRKKVDKRKVDEIIGELEDFEVRYAERLKSKNNEL
ncbi:hypothetical protein SteCoe_14637 [Stentor coeruleus]|uniref:Uncharacterized protein n=1 Tax=Stentor coeruleus TaxID=5963 RepID=A0A1R2C5N0_9CILI|nr:hypothetical protein SteCoe_14637 [Stentor coeruleus]